MLSMLGLALMTRTRKTLWNMRDELIGRVIEVKYKEISKDKDRIRKSSVSIYICLRENGKEVSYD